MNNFNEMMKKAQEMQKKMQEIQEGLASLEVEGTSGGGMVKIIMNCKNEVKKIWTYNTNKKYQGNIRNC